MLKLRSEITTIFLDFIKETKEELERQKETREGKKKKSYPQTVLIQKNLVQSNEKTEVLNSTPIQSSHKKKTL